MAHQWPLVGRDVELARVIGSLDASGVLIVGPPGVGKTRLADEALRAVTGPVLRVRATRASSSMPLGAFAQVVPIRAGGSDGPEASQLRAAVDHLVDGLDPGELLHLSVDDVHALDDTSATLVLQLLMTGRVRAVLTLRTGEPVPEPITVLWRDEIVGRIDLAPLPDPAVTELLGRVLDGGVDGIASAALTRVCGGNLLYLRELVTGLRDSGALSRVGPTWFLLGPITAPPRLTELVEQRLDGLSPHARELLDAVALGEPIGVHGLERHGSFELVDELVRAGLVELVVDGRRRQLRSVHPIHAEVARATMSDAVRRRLLAGLADGAEATGMRRRDDAMRLAAWRLDGGQPADPVALMEGSGRALLGGDPEMARRFAAAALDGSDEPAPRHRAAHLLGLALDLLGRSDEAEQVLAGIEPFAGSGSDRAMLAMARSDNLFRGLGRRDDAEAVLRLAEGDIEDRLLLDELLAQRAVFATLAGEIERTHELVAPLLDSGEPRAFCQAALQTSVVQMLAGQTDTAIEIAVRAFETRIELSTQVQLAEPGVFLVALGLAQLEAGQVELAVGTARAGYDGAVAVRDRHGQAWMSSLLARSHLMAGRLVTSGRFAREAAVVFGDLGHPGARWGLGALALAAGQAGDAAAAEDAVADLDAERPTSVTLMDTELERGRAWAMVAGGRLPAARDHLLAAAEVARGKGHASLESGVLHDVARLGAPRLVVDRLHELATFVEGDLTPARAAHASALVAADGSQLFAAAVRFAEVGANLFAAEAATAAAEAHQRAGAARPAAAARARRDELLARCEGAATPGLRSDAGASGLTRREREVARLAATGRSNREIAEELVVSVRTVENHLQRAYDKLGISRRDELGDALSRVGG